MGCRRMIMGNLDPERERSGGLRTKQAGRGSCRGTMGYLLKEVLKTLCGVNQWSYAVFWKIGCQNPKECYYESIPCSSLLCIPGIDSSELAFEDWEACWVSAELRTPQVGVQAEDKVSSLINKMMMGNRVNVVGEGLVGRAAFTGNHLWIHSHNYDGETHPPEVYHKTTVAVIPVLPQGVVQLGSSLAISENMAIVNDVKSLILQLGCVPGALLSDNYTSKEPVPMIGVPLYPGKSVSTDPPGSYEVKDYVPFFADSCNQQRISSQAMELVGQPSHSLIRQIEDDLHGASTFQIPKQAQNVIKSGDSICQLENGTGAEVIPSYPELWLNRQASLNNRKYGFDEQSYIGSSSANYGNLKNMEEQILSDVLREHVNNNLSTSNGFITSQPRSNGRGLSCSSQLHNGSTSHPRSILNLCSLPAADRSATHDDSWTHLMGSGLKSSKAKVSTSDLSDHLTSNHLLSGSSDLRHHPKDDKCSQIEVGQRKERIENDLFQALNTQLAHLDEHMNFSESISGFGHNSQKHDYGNQHPSSENAKYKDECVQPSSGDDLFDILGVDFKNKLFHESWNNLLNDGSDTNTRTSGKNNYSSSNLQDADSNLYSVNGGNSDSGIFSLTGSDNLLDAVVNKVHTAGKQSLDDSVSCRTKLTKISSSSVPNASLSCGRVSVSDKKQGDLLGFPKSLAKLGAVELCSFKSESSSIYGSQISSWVEQGQSKKHNSSASTGYSKRPEEVGKSNRKRLKPGENPRPRPKDRQMIQDRMKELREIVPNGAKCSIDALLERTIKHMLFLQSVTKHADKLKQTGESKIINKDGGLLLKDNFEGGRTWAYEVGSQSMVSPIIVEDLNSPRQMLVEMLCEERGLFLEIADIIRGLGLTILKGVMETRNDKIWARFTVEANRDVTRMEIFISLVHLLEQTSKNGATSGNSFESDNIVHQSFHQAAAIPATGRPCSLQ
ncbi:unnamed protein product [Camellia sinensis]